MPTPADNVAPVLPVTHSPLDAMTLADRLVVIEAGRTVQQGAPTEVARGPAPPTSRAGWG